MRLSRFRVGTSWAMLPGRVSLGACLVMRVTVDVVMVLIALAVTAALLLLLLDWLLDGSFTAAREWLTTWSTPRDL